MWFSEAHVNRHLLRTPQPSPHRGRELPPGLARGKDPGSGPYFGVQDVTFVTPLGVDWFAGTGSF
jgi:hypothetical protein